MEVKLESKFCRGGNSKQGLYVSLGQSPVLQIVGGDTCGVGWRKVSGCDAYGGKATGRKKRTVNYRWFYRLLSLAKRIRIFGGKKGKGSFTCNESATRGGVSIFCVKDYAGRKGGIAIYPRNGRTISLGTILPDVDNEGAGFLGKVLDSDSYNFSSGGWDNKRDFPDRFDA